MKKIGIITLTGNFNYGNKLQNYALEHFLKIFSFKVFTIKNYGYSNNKKKYLYNILKHFIKTIIEKVNNKNIKKERERERLFINFNSSINYDSRTINAKNTAKFEYDYYIVGSDQVWNPSYYGLRDVDLLSFAEPNKRISYAASFGVENINIVDEEFVIENLKKFKSLSVREEKGKKIVEELTRRDDVEVLVDPTMLLTAEEWNNIAKRPKQLKRDKYILNYFLGNISEEREKEIEKVAKDNNCDIINIMDKNDPLYVSGPREFLYLEKNAFLICTDSFHSSVFAILFDRPFIVFDREQNGVEDMISRIDTLLDKFQIQDRRYTGKITEENLKHDYTEAYKILEKEREKSLNFLKRALS